MAEIEIGQQHQIGLGKWARRSFGFDDISIVPSRRTRDPEDVDICWTVVDHTYPLPLLASAMDGVVSPATAVEIGRLGGQAVLNLEGLWTRYVDADAVLDEIATLPAEKATRVMQELYTQPVDELLIAQRVTEIAAQGVRVAASVTPKSTERWAQVAIAAGLDLLVIQGTVVSAEHVTTTSEPLNLNAFISSLDVPVIVGGCASYQGALHLMRTGAAGVLVGVGPGHACTSRAVLGIGVPQATAVADARAARLRHFDETGQYAHVVADGGMARGGDIAKAIACGADAVMIGSPLAAATEAPGRGHHWGMATFHPSLPRGTRVKAETRGTLKEILVGPAHEDDGRLNLFGALKTSMATCGYSSIKEFQQAEVMIAPTAQTEGKSLQLAEMA